MAKKARTSGCYASISLNKQNACYCSVHGSRGTLLGDSKHRWKSVGNVASQPKTQQLICLGFSSSFPCKVSVYPLQAIQVAKEFSSLCVFGQSLSTDKAERSGEVRSRTQRTPVPQMRISTMSDRSRVLAVGKVSNESAAPPLLSRCDSSSSH